MSTIDVGIPAHRFRVLPSLEMFNVCVYISAAADFSRSRFLEVCAYSLLFWQRQGGNLSPQGQLIFSRGTKRAQKNRAPTGKVRNEPLREEGSERSSQSVSEDRPEIDSFRTKNID